MTETIQSGLEDRTEYSVVIGEMFVKRHQTNHQCSIV